jgi:prepilin-type N-terminal cleavage/methylation domain-containing protein/prepilin-type processing-associated H-X9-DG protein
VARAPRFQSGWVLRRGTAAFTLVELLVVMGILGVLVALLMPALRRARQSAMQARCLSQLNQLGHAVAMYAGEHRGNTPIQLRSVPDFGDPSVFDQPVATTGSHLLGRNVFATLLPYVRGERLMFVCPVALEVTPQGVGAPTELSDTNYIVNGSLTGRQLGPIGGRAAEVIFIQETRQRHNTAWLRPERDSPQVPPNPAPKPATYSRWCWNNYAYLADGSWGQPLAGVHNYGANALFLDGHADHRKHAELRARNFGLTGGTGLGGDAADAGTASHGQSYLSAFD